MRRQAQDAGKGHQGDPSPVYPSPWPSNSSLSASSSRRLPRTSSRSDFFFKKILFIYLFNLVVQGLSCSTRALHHASCKLLVAACGTQFPEQTSNPGSLYWGCRVLAPEPPGKSLGVTPASEPTFLQGCIHQGLTQGLGMYMHSILTDCLLFRVRVQILFIFAFYGTQHSCRGSEVNGYICF